MSFPVARLSDACTHGAVIITGSPDRTVNSLPVARLGDLVMCPLPGHGINPIISVIALPVTDGEPTAHILAQSACGAIIITGSPDTTTY